MLRDLWGCSTVALLAAVTAGTGCSVGTSGADPDRFTGSGSAPASGDAGQGDDAETGGGAGGSTTSAADGGGANDGQASGAGVEDGGEDDDAEAGQTGESETGEGGVTASEGGADEDAQGDEAGESSESTADAEDEGGANDPSPGACPQEDAGNSVPTNAEGSNVGATDNFYGDCGQTGGVEVGFLYTAPRDGLYVFDTVGSGFDTTLSVVLGSTCSSQLFGCSDDIESGNLQSALEVPLTQGDQVVAIVDGYDSSEQGNIQMNVALAQTVCPDVDLGSEVPTSYSGTTVGQGDDEAGSCSSNDAPEVALSWTAPAGGDYIIDTEGSDYDTLLYVHSGMECSGAELACDDDGGTETLSQVTLSLAANDSITIIVDGYQTNSGNFTVSIREG